MLAGELIFPTHWPHCLQGWGPVEQPGVLPGALRCHQLPFASHRQLGALRQPPGAFSPLPVQGGGGRRSCIRPVLDPAGSRGSLGQVRASAWGGGRVEVGGAGSQSHISLTTRGP